MKRLPPIFFLLLKSGYENVEVQRPCGLGRAAPPRAHPEPPPLGPSELCGNVPFSMGLSLTGPTGASPPHCTVPIALPGFVLLTTPITPDIGGGGRVYFFAVWRALGYQHAPSRQPGRPGPAVYSVPEARPPPALCLYVFAERTRPNHSNSSQNRPNQRQIATHTPDPPSLGSWGLKSNTQSPHFLFCVPGAI